MGCGIGRHSILFAEHGFNVHKGDRIAQMVIQKLPDVEVVEVNELSVPSERGCDGFGSSGVK